VIGQGESTRFGESYRIVSSHYRADDARFDARAVLRSGNGWCRADQSGV